MPIVARKGDWEARLDAFLRSHRTREFAYGDNDCCLFVANAVLAMTDIDIASEFRGRYDSRASALSLALSYSGRRSVRALVERALAHLQSVPVLMARRGDIVLVKRPGEFSLGIVSLSGRDILAVAKEGFVQLPLSLAVRAWRV